MFNRVRFTVTHTLTPIVPTVDSPTPLSRHHPPSSCVFPPHHGVLSWSLCASQQTDLLSSSQIYASSHPRLFHPSSSSSPSTRQIPVYHSTNRTRVSSAALSCYKRSYTQKHPVCCKSRSFRMGKTLRNSWSDRVIGQHGRGNFVHLARELIFLECLIESQ